MNELPSDVADIALAISAQFGKQFEIDSLRWLNPTQEQFYVSDHALVIQASDSAPNNDVVIVISNEKHPDVAANAASRAQRAREQLTLRNANSVLTPIYAGRHGKQSYAVYPRKEAFSGNRIIRKLQVLTVTGKIANWLAGVVVDTKCEHWQSRDKSNLFKNQLRFVADQSALRKAIRDDCERYAANIDAADASLFTCLQHGDFWLGNILVERHSIPFAGALSGRFSVIDWGGSVPRGYPFIDLVRFLMSIRMSESQSTKLLDDYASRADLPIADIGLYCMTAMGALGLDLNNFPYERYLSLVQSIHSYLSDRRLT